MKCTIPEISWHNREPVLSVDIYPISDKFYKLASGGGDSHILIWHMVVSENGSVKQELVSDLTRHQKSVNTVRWCSTGQYLASADDDANIIIWQLKTDSIPLLEGDTEDKEVWIVYKVLRGHKEDIYDLCWSTDNLKLLSGSVDNTAIIWDLTKGKLEQIMTDHKGFVQGVAWDPKNQLVATISTDRICRIFDTAGKHVKARIQKGKLPVNPDHYLYNKQSKYFHDDTFKSFYRRLQFTPDGSLLIVPSGHFQADDCKKILNSTLVFTMDNWIEPVAVLPLEKQSSTVVRCCPLLFQHREDGPEPIVKLPYRIIFAVGTDHDIILYDTQQTKPFARFHEIHYTRITDLTWSNDGLLLIASSTDGFCSLITFETEELGKEYVKEESDEENNVMDISETIEISEKDENVDIINKNIKEKEDLKKKTSFLVQWAQNTPKKDSSKKEESDDDSIEIIEITEKNGNIDSSNKKEDIKKRPNFIQQWVQNTPKKLKTEEINQLTPRRNTLKKVETNGIIDKPGVLPNAIKEEINKLIPRRITPKKIGECSKSNSIAKPIEVRRKPREIYNSVTKSIEISNDSIKDKIKSVDKEEESEIDDKLKNGVKDNLKVRLVKLEEIEDIILNKHTEDLDLIVANEKNRKVNSEKVKLVEIKDTKSSTEKEKHTKNKSLVRKKLNVTPSKTNSLLDFLKKSAEKSKKSKTEIDLSYDQEEARDCFNKETTKKVADLSPVAVPLDEDCTEDFNLQLEDSQQEENSKEIKKEITVIELSDDSCSPMKKKIDDDIVQKKPRRVPLITLSSPKGKKQPVTEKIPNE